jgi:hypothetical protein
MTEPLDTTGMMLGELKGQMRELIHNVNNMSQKLDGLTEKVIGAQELPAKVEAIERRVTALETDKNRRDGAMGFGGWLLKSPLIGWLATAAVALWALLKGKIG